MGNFAGIRKFSIPRQERAGLDRRISIPRLARHGLGLLPRWRTGGAPAFRVRAGAFSSWLWNAPDEVPDSSWYTNRHQFHPLTIEQLVRGPNQALPDFSGATIAKAKMSGVTPGLMLKDKEGHSYLIKFDQVNYPNLQSGAEVI